MTVSAIQSAPAAAAAAAQGYKALLLEAGAMADSLLMEIAKDTERSHLQRYGERWHHKAIHPDKHPFDVLTQECKVEDLSERMRDILLARQAAESRRATSGERKENTTLTAKGEIVCDDLDLLYGTTVFRAVVTRIQSYRTKPSVFQWQFIFHALHSMLPYFYSGLTETSLPTPDQACDWTRYKYQICEHLGFDHLPPELGCVASTPRQFGKTTSQAMLMAALLAEVPGVPLLNVTTGARVSQWVSKVVRRYLVQMGPEVSQRMMKNDESTTIRPRGVDPSVRDHPMNSVLFSLPSGAERLRGLSGVFIFLDETAFMESDLLTDFVFPLLSVNSRKMFAISTPSTEKRSFFGRIVTSGKNMGFDVLTIEGMCKECAAKSAKECPHRAAVATPWTSVVNQGKLRDVYEMISRDSYNREMLGGNVDSTVSAFRAESVNRVFGDPTTRFKLVDNMHWAPRCVFMAIDPSGLGTRSDFAVVSFFITEKGEVVVSWVFVFTYWRGESERIRRRDRSIGSPDSGD